MIFLAGCLPLSSAAFLNGWLRPALDLAPRHPSSLIVACIFAPHPARLSQLPALLKPGEGSRRDSGGGAGSPASARTRAAAPTPARTPARAPAPPAAIAAAAEAALPAALAAATSSSAAAAAAALAASSMSAQPARCA